MKPILNMIVESAAENPLFYELYEDRGNVRALTDDELIAVNQHLILYFRVCKHHRMIPSLERAAEFINAMLLYQPFFGNIRVHPRGYSWTLWDSYDGKKYYE